MSAGMVIVGAGEAGTRAALTLRRQNYSGPVTLLSAENRPPYERPPLARELMYGTGEAAAPRPIVPLHDLAAEHIDFRPGISVTRIDRDLKRVRTSDGNAYSYDCLLLATGAATHRLPLSGAASSRFHTFRTFDDAVALRERLEPGIRVAVIGAGFIGLEFAAAARHHGADVTVIESQPRILGRLMASEIVARVEARHRAAGVRLLTGTTIHMIEDGIGHSRLHLAQGGILDVDLVLVATGTFPETTLAQAAGLTIENGIAVDSFMRTSDRSIFAAGDCCSVPLELYGGRRVRLENWRAALEQGVLAARNMLDANAAYAAVPWTWSDQYEFGIEIAGLPDEGVSVVTREMADGVTLYHLDAVGRLVAASALAPSGSIAHPMKIAEQMIAQRLSPDPTGLADPAVPLEELLPHDDEEDEQD